MDRLFNVQVGTADTADNEVEVTVAEYLLCQALHLLRERGAEHERLSIALARHVSIANKLPHRRQKTHVQHAVSLVKDQVANLRQTDL